jgi:hypothetical protein
VQKLNGVTVAITDRHDKLALATTWSGNMATPARRQHPSVVDITFQSGT